MTNLANKKACTSCYAIGGIWLIVWLIVCASTAPKKCTRCGSVHTAKKETDGRNRLAGGAQTSTPGSKPCPSCAETIKAAAIKCRYCGERLDAGPNE